MAVAPHRADLICTCLAHRSQPLGCRRRAPKMGGPLDYPLDSPEGESRPQRTVFGGPTPLTKQVKTAVGPIGPHHAGLLRWAEFSNTRIRTPCRTAWRLMGSGGHFRPCWAPVSTAAIAVSSLSGVPVTAAGMLGWARKWAVS